MHVEVVGAALIARLRPAALRGAAGLVADDLSLRARCGEAEDEDARLVGVEHHGRIARVVLDELRQRIEVRHRADEQPVIVESARPAGMASNRSDAAAREDRQRLTGRPCFCRRGTRGCARRPSRSSRAPATRSGSAFARSLNTLRTNCWWLLAAVLVGREAEVEADHGKRTGLQRGQCFHSLTQRLHGYGC